MTPSEAAALQAKLDRLKPKAEPAPPAPAARPRPPAPHPTPQRPDLAQRLAANVKPEWQVALEPSLGGPTPAHAAKTFANLEEAVQRQHPAEAFADVSPEEAIRLGFPAAAKAIEKVRGASPPGERPPASGRTAPVGGLASPFASEYGTQKAKDVRVTQLERSSGEMGLDPNVMESELADLYFQREARRRGLPPIHQMDPEQYKALREESNDLARRFVASTVGVSERRGNVLADTLPVDERVADVRSGRDLPLLLYPTPVGAAVLGARAREALGGAKAEDQWVMNLLAPFTALARPGVSGIQEGSPVLGQREGKLSWMFRLAPSTAIASWFFDPSLSWSIGGDLGFGGKEHVKKVVEGYDIVDDVPSLGMRYDRMMQAHPVFHAGMNALIPSTAGARAMGTEGRTMAMLGVGGIILVEPDAMSIGTALVGAPIAKAVREFGLGAKVMEHIYQPAVKEWKAMAEAGASITEIAEKAGPIGSPRRLLFDAILRDSIGRIVNQTEGKLGEVANLNPQHLGNLPRVTAAAEAKEAEAAQKLAEATAHADEAGDAVKAELEAETAAERAWRTGANDHSKALIDASKAYDDAEARLISTAALRGTAEDLKAGDVVLDLQTGERLEFHGYTGRGKSPTTYAIISGEDGVRRKLSMNRVLRVGDPQSWPEVKKVMDDLMRLKARRDALIKMYDIGAVEHDVAKMKAAEDGLRRLRGSTVANLRDEAFALAYLEWRESRKGLQQANTKLMEYQATVPGRSKGTLKALAELDKAKAAAERATDAATVATRQANALRDAHTTFAQMLDDYEVALESWSRASQKGDLAQRSFDRAILQDMFTKEGDRYLVDGPAYKRALIAKYGTDAVDGAMRTEAGRAIDRLLRGDFSVSAGGFQRIRDLEQTMFAEAEASRRLAFAPAENALTTLAEFKGVVGMSKEAWVARAYQYLQKLQRVGDWVGGSALGRSPAMIREVARRSFERYFDSERALGVIGKAHGVQGIRDFITSRRKFFGFMGNQDTVTIADKALLHLRALLAATVDDRRLWHENVVVQALETAPLPSFAAARMTPSIVGTGLQRFIEDPTTTGAELVQWLEEAAPALYHRMIGRTDSPDVQFRFIATAVVQAANEYDTMFDLVRTTGHGIDAKAANAMNWMAVPEQIPKSLDVEGGWRVAQTYGMPRLKQQRGAMAHLLRAEDVENRMVRVAIIDGKEHWIPEKLWKTIQSIPRKLAKDNREFGIERSLAGATLDKFLRLWRVSVVNGYMVPRAAHFVNTFFGDWSQMVTAIGWAPATRIAAQNAVAYVPFVGPRLQDALSEMSRTHSLLPALINPDLARVMQGAEDLVIDTREGPMTALRFLHEAHLAGCFDSISTKDLVDATARHLSSWNPLQRPSDLFEPAPHIEATARFLEEIQHRNRVLLYLEARTGKLTGQKMSAEEARSLLREAMYDWKTGIPAHEVQTIGKIAMFWTYRRGMFRQLGASLTEAFTGDGSEYIGKALVGRTKLARAKQFGHLASAGPGIINWQDPEGYTDDEEQLKMYGLNTAPWWVDSEAVFGNREVSEPRRLWYSEVGGRHVTFESLMLPSMTTLDQLWMLNLFITTGMATVAHLGEKAGLRPTMTTTGADMLWERNVDAFSDMMMPGLDDAVNGALRPIMGEGKYRSQKGVPVPLAQAVLLRQLGWEDFIAAHPDPDGQIRVDATALGIATNLVLSFPPVADLARNWLIFGNNPGYQESVTTGLIEAMSRWTGLLKPQGHDPFKSATYEAEAKERRLKEERSKLRKQVFPTPE